MNSYSILSIKKSRLTNIMFTIQKCNNFYIYTVESENLPCEVGELCKTQEQAEELAEARVAEWERCILAPN